MMVTTRCIYQVICMFRDCAKVKQESIERSKIAKYKIKFKKIKIKNYKKHMRVARLICFELLNSR